MKLKRLLTTALSAVMALSVCALPAMAEGTRTNGTPVWGDATTGSITIHKFEYNGTGNTATGAEGETAPAGAKPLGGVTFEIYQVQNEAWLENYYNGVQAIDTSKLSADKYYTKDSTGKITVDGALTPEQTIITDAITGVATANNLALGLYLVVETNAPDKVTAPVAPFLVSVPMTRIADNATTNKLTDWIFDVHVYPKNSTTYGEVTIEKKGYTGGSDGTLLQGVKFILEKHTGEGNEATDWTEVVASEQDPTKTFELVTDAYGQIKLSGLSQGEYRIHEDSYAAGSAAANKGYILDQTYHTFTVNSDGTITYDTNAGQKAITIPVENDRPDMEKEVKNSTGWEKDAQYGVGDTVSYKITIEIPKNIAKLKTFTVTDTPMNLNDKTDTIEVVKVKTAGEATDTPLEKGTDYTVEPNGASGFKLTFNQSESVKGCAGRTVTVTYDAVVMNSAVVGGNGNSNKATLEYTNKIKSDGTPDDTSKNTIEDSAVMYSFGIKIVKTQEDNKTALPGVKFDLYREAKTGETSVITGEDAKKVGLDKDKGWILVKKDLTTDAKGIIDTSVSGTANFTGGLANGEYYLVETKTVDGYNLLTKPVEVNLNVTYTTTWKTSDTFDNTGKLVKHKVDTIVFTNANGDTAKKELTVTNIINRKGFNLPVTGGFGTLLFSGIGVLLVLAGVSVLFSLKKKNNRA